MKIITWLLFTFICLLPAGSMAQNKVTLSGKITDQHGTPVAQATIAVENTTSGTYTDDQGKYSLQVTPGKHTFVVSFLGYQTVKQSFDIRQDKKQNFTLQESSVALNSVEVYGKTQTQKVKEGAFAVNALDIKPIVNSLNNLNDLVNRTTGIKVREEGGVGSDFDLSINGLSGNSVRYFLDGMPLDTKGSGVSLANLPINIIDRIEIYKGVVPASLGTDALGGTINIITKQEKKDYLDVSYGIGSFHTHKADLNAQFVEKKTGLIVRPTVGINYSKNDYRMKNVQMRDESGDNFIYGNPKRFHDGYFSLLAQVEAGFVNKSWADAFFVSASYSKTDKELADGVCSKQSIRNGRKEFRFLEHLCPLSEVQLHPEEHATECLPLPHLGPFLDRGHCLSEVLLGRRIHREPAQRDYGQRTIHAPLQASAHHHAHQPGLSAEYPSQL